VEILDETQRYRPLERLERALSALLAELGSEGQDLTVVLVDDVAMHERNARDRGVDAPTDVLSYPTVEPDDVGFPSIDHLGDIFISLDTAARQAHERGTALDCEVMVLAAHGLTHLRGFDHTSEAAWEPFRAAERRILSLAGAEPAPEDDP
jgi:probable rRNA maturation factor